MSLFKFAGPRTASRFALDEKSIADAASLPEIWSISPCSTDRVNTTDPISSTHDQIDLINITDVPQNSRVVRVTQELFPCAILRGPETGGAHTYCPIGAETFQVRGPHYGTDKIKVPSSPSALELMHADSFRSRSRLGNVAARRHGWLRQARAAGDKRFYLIVAYITPSPPFIYLVFYLAVNPARMAESPHLQRTWQRFTSPGTEGDAFRNERWKVIPRIPEGSWVVQHAVGSKPALLGTKLTHTWLLYDYAATGLAAGAASSSASHELGPYLEGDCDVASSKMAQALVSLIQQYAKLVTIDLAFVIEARDEDELPEALLGAVRLSHLDVEKMQIDAALPDDEVLGRPGVFFATESQ